MYRIFPIKSPASPSHFAAYKAIRLTSLQLDPQVFSSNYAREVAFTEDDWRMRLDSASGSKQTFIASVLDKSHDSEPKEDAKDGDEGEWIGTAAVAGPSDIPPSIIAPFKEAGVGENWAIYGFFAMWVHPDHRGKGIGVKLVEACLEWVRTDGDVKFSNENRGGEPQKVVTLLVASDNVAGQGLYTRTGFVDLEEMPLGEGKKLMYFKV